MHRDMLVILTLTGHSSSISSSARSSDCRVQTGKEEKKQQRMVCAVR